MTLLALVCLGAAILIVVRARVPGSEVPPLGSVSERWLAEHRAGHS